MRLAANLGWLFAELPPLARFAAAREAGFDGVELLFPYDRPVRDWADAAGAAGLPVVQLNTPADPAAGDWGCAALPGEGARFRAGFLRAEEMAQALGAARIHVLSGVAEGPEARAQWLRNLDWAAGRGRALSVEPINRQDAPGYFLGDFECALDLLDALGAPDVGLQFDTWHAWRMTGAPLALWDRLAPRVAHVQVAGAPGRGEPDDATHAALWPRLARDGYRGWVSGEYRPAAGTAAGLGWMAAARAPGPG